MSRFFATVMKVGVWRRYDVIGHFIFSPVRTNWGTKMCHKHEIPGYLCILISLTHVKCRPNVERTSATYTKSHFHKFSLRRRTGYWVLSTWRCVPYISWYSRGGGGAVAVVISTDSLAAHCSASLLKPPHLPNRFCKTVDRSLQVGTVNFLTFYDPLGFHNLLPLLKKTFLKCGGGSCNSMRTACGKARHKYKLWMILFFIFPLCMFVCLFF